MAHIYSSGTVMLSAVAAPDGTYGLLRQRNIMRSHTWNPWTKSEKQRWKHVKVTSYLSDEKKKADEDWDAPDKELPILWRERAENEKGKGPLCYHTQSEWTSYVDGGPHPLDTRGWCYQEYIMAPRVIHFGVQKLTWECATLRWAEDFGLGSVEAFGDSKKSMVDAFVRERHGKATETEQEVAEETGSKQGLQRRLTKISAMGINIHSDMHARLSTFYRCVDDYRRRNLTFGTDMLPAFSGLASVFQHPHLGQYIAGLWEADLIYGLGRHLAYGRAPIHPRPEHSPPAYIGPSWSWAGFPPGAVFDANDIRDEILGGFGERADSGKAGVYAEWESKFKPSVVSHKVELATSDPYGKIKSAEIVLRGWCRPVLVYFGKRPPGFVGSSASFNFDTGQERLGQYPWKFPKPYRYINHWGGWPEDLPEGVSPGDGEGDGKDVREYTALQIGLECGPISHKDMSIVMLILDAVEGSEGTFRRVGTFCRRPHEDEMVPEMWEERMLKLI